MGVCNVASQREKADRAGITDREWRAFREASHPLARSYYIHLRQAIADVCETFVLPANELAMSGFYDGRRDRKFYLRMTQELMRLGLIERVEAASPTRTGRTAPARYMFTIRDDRPDNIVFLSSWRANP